MLNTNHEASVIDGSPPDKLILKSGQVVKINGIPVELLADVPVMYGNGLRTSDGPAQS